MIRRLCAALAALTLIACVANPATAAAAAASTWPQTGADACMSYYNPNETIVNMSTVGKLKLRWQLPFSQSKCPGRVGPVIAGGLTLTQDTSGLKARDSTTGRVVWRESAVFADRLAHNIVVSGAVVVVTSSDTRCTIEGGDADGLVYAFDLATGRLLGRSSTPTATPSQVDRHEGVRKRGTPRVESHYNTGRN